MDTVPKHSREKSFIDNMRNEPFVRRCVGCRANHSKNELIRIVRTPGKEVMLDPDGKKPGRGAYLCYNPDCLKKSD